MSKFVLGKPRKDKFLIVENGKETYRIPLAGSLTRKEAATLKDDEGTEKFLRKYLPAEIMDTIVQAEYKELVQAWVKASNEESEKTLGE